jgi:hypothetical protein
MHVFYVKHNDTGTDTTPSSEGSLFESEIQIEIKTPKIISIIEIETQLK